MSPDIDLYEVTAGGLWEPKADWTAAAHHHVTEALSAVLKARNTNMLAYSPPKNDPSKAQIHHQLVKLHDEVGMLILNQIGNAYLRLPTKEDKFDWSLGPDVRALRNEYGSDYGLFVFLRDGYASAGRVIVMVLAVAAFGQILPGGTQVGFASLVDLHSGDILWFNRLINPTGNLREPEPARKAIETLLADFPL